MAINLIDKIVPKNGAFRGMVDAEQVMGLTEKFYPYAMQGSLISTSAVGSKEYSHAAFGTQTNFNATISSNGKYIVTGAPLKISNDYGVTFSISHPSIYCTSAAIVNNGRTQLVLAPSVAGNITDPVAYRSDDYGVTFTRVFDSLLTAVAGLSGEESVCLCCSEDEKYIYVAYSQSIWSSADGGVTWTGTALSVPTINGNIACSRDGKYVLCTMADNAIKVSSNYGATYSNGGSITDKTTCAMSNDGKYQIVAGDANFSGTAAISSNYGGTWATVGGLASNYSCCAISGDGRIVVLFAISPDRFMAVSYNYGATWSRHPADLSLSEQFAATMSSDGKVLVAFDYSEKLRIFISSTDVSGPITAEGAAFSDTVSIERNSTENVKKALIAVDHCQISNLRGGKYFGGTGVAENQLAVSNIGRTYKAVPLLINGLHSPARCIAMSSDGKYIYAGVNGDIMARSDDYGLTFKQAYNTKSWASVATSKNGKTVVTGVNNEYFYLSNDYGVSWSLKDSMGTGNWGVCLMSGDGRVILLTGYNTITIMSIDGGTTWKTVNQATDIYWLCGGMSNDGKIIYLLSDSNLYKSMDYGVTWVVTGVSTIHTSMAVSDNGSIAVIVDVFGVLRISTDYGNNWIVKDHGYGSSNSYVTITADGKTIFHRSGIYNLVATDDETSPYTTWTMVSRTPGSATWTALAMSSDGKLIAFSDDTKFYLSGSESRNVGHLTADNDIKTKGNLILNGVQNVFIGYSRTNLIPDGSFDGNIANWSLNGGALIEDGVLKMTGSQNCKKQIDTINGNTYILEFDFFKADTSSSVTVGSTESGTDLLNDTSLDTGKYSSTFIAAGSTSYLSLITVTGSESSIWDNVAVYDYTAATSTANPLTVIPTHSLIKVYNTTDPVANIEMTLSKSQLTPLDIGKVFIISNASDAEDYPNAVLSVAGATVATGKSVAVVYNGDSFSPQDYAPTTHTHSSLAASDGDPDPALSMDAAGNMTVVGDIKTSKESGVIQIGGGSATTSARFKTEAKTLIIEIYNGSAWEEAGRFSIP